MEKGDISNNLKNKIITQFAQSGIYNQGIEGLSAADDFVKSIPNENLDLEKTNNLKMKKYKKKDLDKKQKFEIVQTNNKKETKEATTSGGSGQYSQPLFSQENKVSKKIEATEATSSSSSGQYSTPKVWAKSMDKKDFRGYSKPQIKGGQFVQVKKKCKKFPYCNQGDINALNIFENQTLQKVIENVAKKYNIKEYVVKNMIAQELGLIK